MVNVLYVKVASFYHSTSNFKLHPRALCVTEHYPPDLSAIKKVTFILQSPHTTSFICMMDPVCATGENKSAQIES